MTRDDIIRMAREAATEDGSVNRDDGKDVVLYAAKTTLFLERFAALVAEQERQDCARVVMSFKNWTRVDLLPIAEAIKSRRLDIKREQA